MVKMGEQEQILNDLFNNLLNSLKTNRLISDVNDKNLILYSILCATKKKRSKIFHDSSLKLNPSKIDNEHIIELEKDGEKQYAISYKGITHILNSKYNIKFEEQFYELINNYESELKTLTKHKPFVDKEILASLSLILLSSISESSAIRLNSTNNQETFEKLLDEIIIILKQHDIIHQDYQLKRLLRKESKSSALMARLDMLPIKTNHSYKYIKTESGYYFDLVKNDGINEKTLNIILDLIFNKYNPYKYDNVEFYNRLFDLYMNYSFKFLDRTINNDVSYLLIRKIKSYLETGIYLKK